MNVYYYVPESDKPSWGAGMIYYHVWLLQKNKINAYILHDRRPFKLSWLKLDIPFLYLNDKNFSVSKDDILVIPEFYADLPQLKIFRCRKIVFVQNAFYIFDGLKNNCTYEDLGINTVFYYMPHLKKVLQQITQLPLYEVPPFIAPYYFSENNKQRKKRIILYPKFASREYEILKRLLKDKIGLEPKKMLQKIFDGKDSWEMIELKDKTHHEVAKEMQQAAFFVSINTTEAFNSSVPEAMAAGCINICYEGVGPADFLENNVNAYVFSNNHVYEMADKIITLINQYNNIEDELASMRSKALNTAYIYTIENLESTLISFFRQNQSSSIYN